jgi:hypothetical protein
MQPSDSRADRAWRVPGTIILVAVLGMGCVAAPTESPLFPPATPAPTLSTADLILQNIIARQDAETPDPQANLLPSSMSSYLLNRNIPQLVVKDSSDSLVGKVCRLLDVPLLETGLEKGVDYVLTELRHEGAGKGIGLLISAAGFGCKTLVPHLSQQVLLTDPVPLPTIAPRAQTQHAKLGEAVPVVRGGTAHYSVMVEDVRCVARTTTLEALPGYALLAARVRIDSQSDGLAYDGLNWDLTTDHRDSSWFVPTSDEPYVPYLTYGTLNANQYVDGWLLFHAPVPTSSIEVIYRGSPTTVTPVMEVDRGTCNAFATTAP